MSAKSTYVGVDLGGTNFSIAVGDAEGRIAVEEKHATRSHDGPDAVLDRIATAIKGFAAYREGSIAGVGMGLPGLVDIREGVSRFLPNLPTQWRDVPVRARLEEALRRPVRILNDARAAALGEFLFGHGRSGMNTLVFLTLGTGVGGGVVVDGRLRLGRLGAAGEIGHICVDPQGPWCGCGSRGCLETFASGPAITAEGIRLMLSGNAPGLHAICGGDIAAVSPLTMSQAARQGEDSVAFALSQVGKRIGMAVAHVVSALHPDAVVLGGGVAALDELLLEPVRRVLEARVRMFPAQGVRVLRAQLGDRAGMYGGLAAAIRGDIQEDI